MFKYINSDEEHNRILFELGILDDMEDWELFKLQEDKFNETLNTIDIQTYFKYVQHKRMK